MITFYNANTRLYTGVDIDKVANGKIIEHGGPVNTFETLLEHHLIKPVQNAKFIVYELTKLL